MAKAAKYVVAEVEEISEEFLDPDNIHTPGIFVDAVVLTETNHKPIEKLTNIENTIKSTIHKDPLWTHRIRIAKRAALEVPRGVYMNLGIGIPALVPSMLPSDFLVTL